MTLAPSAIDYNGLVQSDRVHGRLYYDPDVFDEEMERIWHREWVYVGHESEVSRVGDSQERRIGRHLVTMFRDDQNRVRLVKDSSTLMGESQPPYTAQYRGFVFGRLSSVGPSLDTHLGPAKRYIDQFVDLAPDGEIELTAGVQKGTTYANWKMQPENWTDNYHAGFVHSTALSSRRAFGKLNPTHPQSGAVQRYLGGGHAHLDFKGLASYTRSLAAADGRLSEGDIQAYAEALQDRHGKERAEQILKSGSPHLVIFPNLILIQAQVRRIEPISAVETNVYMYPALHRGASAAINSARLRLHEFGYGPAGLISPDDGEIFERNQQSLGARLNEWIVIRRGVQQEHIDEEGLLSGHIADELTLRTFWAHYRALMTKQ
jgi:phenylpropionate dioxygenase-like ring-hydroxylating dioxygenase large terminal subunit